jgi:hypothetical protein
MERYRADSRPVCPSSCPVCQSADICGSSNVPGVALYFYTLSSLRNYLASIPYFAGSIPFQTVSLPTPTSSRQASSSTSTLVRLNSQGNLLAGAIARSSVGFILNPITVIKARYEVGIPCFSLSIPPSRIANLKSFTRYEPY